MRTFSNFSASKVLRFKSETLVSVTANYIWLTLVLTQCSGPRLNQFFILFHACFSVKKRQIIPNVPRGKLSVCRAIKLIIRYRHILSLRGIFCDVDFSVTFHKVSCSLGVAPLIGKVSQAELRTRVGPDLVNCGGFRDIVSCHGRW